MTSSKHHNNEKIVDNPEISLIIILIGLFLCILGLFNREPFFNTLLHFMGIALLSFGFLDISHRYLNKEYVKIYRKPKMDYNKLIIILVMLEIILYIIIFIDVTSKTRLD